MKKATLNKKLAALFAILFIVFTTAPAFSGHNRYPYARSSYHGGHGHHHRYSNEDIWLAWGVGLLTLGLISYAVNTPAPPRVVREYAYAPPPRLPHVDKVMVTALELNVRSGPGLNHAIAGHVVAGETLEVLGSAPGWFYVRTAYGLYGWVMVDYTVPQRLPAG